MRGVTTKNARSHPNHCEESPRRPISGGMAPHRFFLNNSISDVIKLRVALVGVTPHTTQLRVTHRTPLFEGKKLKIKKPLLPLERAGYY